MKICTKCRQEKDLEEFHRFNAGRDGHRSECKKCAIARTKRYYDAKVRPRFNAGPTASTCRQCGATFEYIKSTGPARVYCSERCRYLGGEQIKKNLAAITTRACACGSTDVQKVGKAVCPACRKDPRDNESNRARERRRILRLYNITQADWETMVARQGNRCAICDTDAPGGRGESWSIDHDHRCCPGKGSCGRCVRGLLCSGCNLFIGNADDDPVRLRAAAAYIEHARLSVVA